MWKKLFCPPCLTGLILVILAIGGYFLLRDDYQAPTSTPPEITIPEEAPEITSEVKEVTIVGTEMLFSPATIAVQAGQPVKITFQNGGTIIHNLVIEGLGVSSRTIGPGQSDVVEFTAPAPGTYTIFLFSTWSPSSWYGRQFNS